MIMKIKNLFKPKPFSLIWWIKLGKQLQKERINLQHRNRYVNKAYKRAVQSSIISEINLTYHIQTEEHAISRRIRKIKRIRRRTRNEVESHWRKRRRERNRLGWRRLG